MILDKFKNKKKDKSITPSEGYKNYLKNIKIEKIKIFIMQIALLIFILGIWEILANKDIISTFLFSKPSAIYDLFMRYMENGQLWVHVKTSVYETVLGLIIGTVGGVIVAILLWAFPRLSRVLDPFLVVLNALPKTALAPIVIVWVGANVKGMLKSFKATKLQILFKLILPANIGNLINIIKINIGMAWVGVIVGEFLVSRNGIGYLIVYGSQVFKLDIVMMGVFVLAVCAWIMYEIVNIIEKLYKNYR